MEIVRKKLLKNRKCLKSQKGFTLIELLSVMVIMSVFASITVQRFDLLSSSATNRAVETIIAELNVRETLTWTNIKMSTTGWTTDEELFLVVQPSLIPRPQDTYQWSSGPAITGGILLFENKAFNLARSASTGTSAAQWQ
jgi:prepilin-type N-terminal cleavage/methylation domain-containing protein